MKLYYYTTDLEDRVTKLYKNLNIQYPHDIDENYIARKLRIFIHRKPQESFYEVVGRYRGITIDVRVNKEKQREMFFHELGHILRHYGSQSSMPVSFRQYQEWDATNFMKYALIPYHMLHFIDFHDPNVIDKTAKLFCVTPELCEKRLIQIENRNFTLSNDVKYYNNVTACNPKTSYHKQLHSSVAENGTIYNVD